MKQSLLMKICAFFWNVESMSPLISINQCLRVWALGCSRISAETSVSPPGSRSVCWRHHQSQWKLLNYHANLWLVRVHLTLIAQHRGHHRQQDPSNPDRRNTESVLRLEDWTVCDFSFCRLKKNLMPILCFNLIYESKSAQRMCNWCQK